MQTKMEEKQRYFRLGLFVILTLLLTVGTLFVLGGRSLFAPNLTFESYFDRSVAGLDIGAPVQFRGIPLGEVVEITGSASLYEGNKPVAQRHAYIVVRATLKGQRVEIWEEEWSEYVNQGLRVQTQLAGITGQQYLSLDLLDADQHPPLPFDWTPEYPYLPSGPSLTSEIMANLQSLVDSLQQADLASLGQHLNQLTLTANRKVEQIPVEELAAQLNGLLTDARNTVDRLDRILASAPIDATVRNMASASVRLDRLLGNPALQQTVEGAGAVAGRLGNIAQRGEFDRITQNLDDAVERADALLADSRYDLQNILRDLRVVAENLRSLSDNLRNNPSGALLGAPPERVQFPQENR